MREIEIHFHQTKNIRSIGFIINFIRSVNIHSYPVSLFNLPFSHPVQSNIKFIENEIKNKHKNHSKQKYYNLTLEENDLFWIN